MLLCRHHVIKSQYPGYQAKGNGIALPDAFTKRLSEGKPFPATVMINEEVVLFGALQTGFSFFQNCIT
jgi:hypothetical protein